MKLSTPVLGNTPHHRSNETAHGNNPPAAEIDAVEILELDTTLGTPFPLSLAREGVGPLRAIATFAVLFLALIGSVQVEDGLAQGGWNRKSGAIVAYEQGSGSGTSLSVLWSFSVEPATFERDLSTRVDVFVNGSLFSSQLVGLLVRSGSTYCGSPPCNGSCGSVLTGGGQVASMLCYVDGPPPSDDCDCGQKIMTPIPEPYHPQAGDEIAVLLRPAPGALPESDTSDDRMSLIHEGGPSFWNRGIRSVQLVENSAGGHDVRVEGAVEFDGMGSARYLDLGTEVLLQINGTTVASKLIAQDVEPASGSCFYLGCGNYCGVIGGIERNCDNVLFNGCMCGGLWLALFPHVPTEPGDEITVILRPAPGALPELPGFEGDDDYTLDGTSSTEAGTEAAIGQLLDVRPNPAQAMTGAELRFQLDRPAAVRLEIIDVHGRSVRTLANGKFAQGSFTRVWNGATDAGSRVPNGVYFSALTLDGGEPQVKKLLLVD